MNFKILKINEENKTMVIDWGNGYVLNHYIPYELLNNENISKEEAVSIIEHMRPEQSKNNSTVSSILNTIKNDSSETYYTDTGTGEDVI